MAIQRDGVLVDLGSKSEGIIPPHEMHSMGADPLSKVAVGEKILVYVMQPEADRGRGPALGRPRARRDAAGACSRALRRRRELRRRSHRLQQGRPARQRRRRARLRAAVAGRRRAARTATTSDGGLGQAVGKQLRLKVIEINRRRNRVILSERAALQEWRSQQKDRLLAELKEGEVRKGRVSSVRSFGVFIDLGGADGLAHLSEVSWDRNKSPEEHVQGRRRGRRLRDEGRPGDEEDRAQPAARAAGAVGPASSTSTRSGASCPAWSRSS